MGWLFAVGLGALFITAGYAWGREWFLSRRRETTTLTVTEAQIAEALGLAAREWRQWAPGFECARTLLFNPDPVERWILAGGDASLEEFLEREKPVSSNKISDGTTRLTL